MKPFSLLVKPTSYRCNLRCSYCFYLGKERIFKDSHFMSEEILERMVSTFLALGMPVSSFGWQGGEPTLMGLDFFKKATFFQEKYGRPGQQVSNGLQTNGTLLDDEWCAHLAKYNFLVGVSLDGPPEIHDRHRVGINGEPSHELVMKGVQALTRNHVSYNILTLVSDANVRQPLAVYNYLKNLGIHHHQYIECVEFDADGELAPYSVDAPRWGEFLCALFDEWYEKDKFNISVRLFDSVLTQMVDRIPNVCSISKDCRHYFVVEHNGDVYPCDFFVLPELRLGNVMDGKWEDFVESETYKSFGSRKHRWNEKCQSCRYLDFCGGCCPKNRPAQGGGTPSALSVLCEGWQMFYQHTLPRFKTLANRIRKERDFERKMTQAGRQTKAADAMSNSNIPGRNEPCHCGSGTKYKKCCGK